MKRRIIIAACLLLVGVLGAAGTVVYLAFGRPPANPPAEACADGRRPDARPAVVAAGSSSIQGRLGADWVGALRERPEHREYEFVNAGINGDTSADLRRRVDTDIVACRPSAVMILIGGNDVRDGVPLDQYRENLDAIVERVKSRTTARIALLSLPPLGEDLDAALNRKLTAYNTVIRETAARAQVDYLPVHEQLADLLRQRGGDPAPYDFSFLLAFGAAAQHYLFGQSWDEVSRNGGRELHVDHIHLNDRGGAIITELAAQWLTTAN
ncbi:GDSL-type esterase/lipase family protein [Micromonospora sp. WMMD1102]|uniref:SGNH/GDSL hydrolase family protein n=1 Tax=Micromonospora sp. WMMD1102 TaxID=3016105 RepID=UPI002415387B|nr:GDSL-type esterase/lipase family protein [Micromonospora sp. WMMD1102]MDG4791179.1 GDSL-type esterase/lipase family protein [Micromonospora sp. WMMD1102]